MIDQLQALILDNPIYVFVWTHGFFVALALRRSILTKLFDSVFEKLGVKTPDKQ
jgi:hypothetical protein